MDTTENRQLIDQAQHHAEELNKILEEWPNPTPDIIVNDDGRVDILLPDGTFLLNGEEQRLNKIKQGIKGQNDNAQEQ